MTPAASRSLGLTRPSGRVVASMRGRILRPIGLVTLATREIKTRRVASESGRTCPLAGRAGAPVRAREPGSVGRGDL